MELASEDFQALSQRFYDAVHQVMCADATAMLALWSEQNDVTYCDPYGGFHSGREGLVNYWQQAALRNRDAPGAVSVTAEILMVQAGKDLVSMVVKDHIRIKQPDQVAQLQALATNIYRYEEGQWRMLHRHSSNPLEEV